MPTRTNQRLRARMMLRKRLTLSATAAGGLPASTTLELPARQPVLPLEEEGAAELEPDADQLRAPDQHGVEGGDRLVEQLVPLLLRHARPVRCADRREAVGEQRVGVDRLGPDQRQQDRQRRGEPALADQGLRPGEVVLHRLAGVRRRRLGGERRSGEGKGGGGRERAEDPGCHDITREKRGRPEGRPGRYAV